MFDHGPNNSFDLFLIYSPFLLLSQQCSSLLPGAISFVSAIVKKTFDNMGA
jgi:hypothetical protein